MHHDDAAEAAGDVAEEGAGPAGEQEEEGCRLGWREGLLLLLLVRGEEGWEEGGGCVEEVVEQVFEEVERPFDVTGDAAVDLCAVVGPDGLFGVLHEECELHRSLPDVECDPAVGGCEGAELVTGMEAKGGLEAHDFGDPWFLEDLVQFGGEVCIFEQTSIDLDEELRV